MKRALNTQDEKAREKASPRPLHSRVLQFDIVLHKTIHLPLSSSQPLPACSPSDMRLTL